MWLIITLLIIAVIFAITPMILLLRKRKVNYAKEYEKYLANYNKDY